MSKGTLRKRIFAQGVYLFEKIAGQHSGGKPIQLFGLLDAERALAVGKKTAFGKGNERKKK